MLLKNKRNHDSIPFPNSSYSPEEEEEEEEKDDNERLFEDDEEEMSLLEEMGLTSSKTPLEKTLEQKEKRKTSIMAEIGRKNALIRALDDAIAAEEEKGARANARVIASKTAAREAEAEDVTSLRADVVRLGAELTELGRLLIEELRAKRHKPDEFGEEAATSSSAAPRAKSPRKFFSLSLFPDTERETHTTISL